MITFLAIAHTILIANYFYGLGYINSEIKNKKLSIIITLERYHHQDMLKKNDLQTKIEDYIETCSTTLYMNIFWLCFNITIAIFHILHNFDLLNIQTIIVTIITLLIPGVLGIHSLIKAEKKELQDKYKNSKNGLDFFDIKT